MLTIFVFSICIPLWSLIVLLRNNQVYSFRLKLINKIYDYNMALIFGDLQKNLGQIGSSKPKVCSKLIAYDTTGGFRSYLKMVFLFWRPLKSFYKGTELEKFLD